MIFIWICKISERRHWREHHLIDIINIIYLHTDIDGMIVEEDGQETEVILCQDHVLGHHQGLARGDIGDVVVIAILL
jgi:hypothetical protein